jgi:MoxR-like ATPase
VKIEELRTVCDKMLSEISTVIVGKRQTLELVLTGFLANGHILFEDFPGLAKTLLSKLFAQGIGCRFRRIQFTPDLLPADITGTYVLNRRDGEFTLRRGPIFANILLADEINRAPPKTQSALLEGMQERQVTIEGDTFPLERPFIVIATQNPIEYEGTYPLPEAQIDRFMMRLSIGYPNKQEEVEILTRRINSQTDDYRVNAIMTPELFQEAQNVIEKIHVDDTIKEYVVEIVQKTRTHSLVGLGASPRGALAMMHLSRAKAALTGRDFVVPEDVKAVAVGALSHRLLIKSGTWLAGTKAEEIVRGILDEVKAPRAG